MTTQHDAVDVGTVLTTGTAFDEFASNIEIGSTVASPSSSGNYYFPIFVVVIGFVETVTNALIVYALVASGEHKKHVLILNQNVLDLVGCFFLFTRYATRLADIDFSGTSGFWICVLVINGGPSSFGLQLGSLINLASIAVERYLLVVHAIWSKNNLHRWMINIVAAFAWISGIVIGCAAGIPTTGVVNGVCKVQSFWHSKASHIAYGIWYFFSFYVIIIAICIYCYGQILIVIRRQANAIVSATHSSAAQVHANQIQSSVIKTMILVCAFFAVTWAPWSIYTIS